jgi:hypothetical protein
MQSGCSMPLNTLLTSFSYLNSPEIIIKREVKDSLT